MLILHQHYAELPTWGERSQQLAAPYAANIWAIRWRELIQDVYQAKTIKQYKNNKVAKNLA
ncbi:MAG: hypothetical protein KAF91_28855 [Nostoc sp. TH1S01]|nr:hypothetical protein [Nostoc sp. TH1S01]